MEDHHLYLNLGGWGSGLRFTRVTDVDVVDNDGFVSAAIFADIDDDVRRTHTRALHRHHHPTSRPISSPPRAG